MKLRKTGARAAALGLCFALLAAWPGLRAAAYINRGTVTVSLGAASAQLAAGQSVSVSAALTPASHDELPGCGMAFCPQDCSAGCLNSTNDCTCNGTEYTAYQAGMTLTSANTAIATARYADGVILITGHAAGTTTVTAVGTLRQYSNSAPQAILVTVTGSTPGAVSAAQASSSASGGTTSETSSAQAQTVSGQLGTFDIFEIGSVKTGKAELTAIQSSEKSAAFEKKDASGNVAYSWTFKGSDVTNPQDMDFTLSLRSSNESAMRQAGTLSSPTFLSFSHKGALPGKATVSVNTGSTYADGTALYLYTYDTQTKKLRLAGGNVALSGGYASFGLTHCSDYVLVTKPIAAKNRLPLPVLAALCAVAAAAVAAVAVLLLLRRKRAPAAAPAGKGEQP